MIGLDQKPYCKIKRKENISLLSIDCLRSPLANFVPQEFLNGLLQNVLNQVRHRTESRIAVRLPLYALLAVGEDFTQITLLPKLVAAGKNRPHETWSKPKMPEWHEKSDLEKTERLEESN